MPSSTEVTRRYDNIRANMREQGIDALIVCGNQYAGFEGAVFYTSGFEIVHRYVYVLVPLADDPVLVFPQEALRVAAEMRCDRYCECSAKTGA